MAVIFQLCSILGFTIGNSLWHKPVKVLPITFIISVKSLITSSFFLVGMLIASQFEASDRLGITQPFNHISIYSVLYAMGLCAVSYWGLYFFNRSLKHTASGITITVAGMGTLIGFMMAIFVYHEKVTLINITSSLLGTFGLWCLEKFNPGFFKLKFTKGMLFGLLSMLFWRIGGLFPLAIDRVGVMLFSLILEVTVFLISITLFIFSKKIVTLEMPFVKNNLMTILFIAITNFAGILGNHLTLKFTSFVNYTILGFLAPIVTFFISLVFYKEKYTKIQFLGIIIIVFGGLVLNFVQQLLK